MREMEATNAAYQAALDALAVSHAVKPREPSGIDLDEEERKLLEEEARLDAEISAVAKEKLELDAQPRQTLGKVEEWFVQRVARAEYEAHMLKEAHAAQTSVAAHTSAMLTDLKATNILDHVFHIWFDGYFGTINGLRLGRLASQPVDWTELNAAWGETLLLLVTMSRTQQCTFQGCTLVPLGNTSHVIFPDKSVCELYGSSDLSLGKFFWGRRYDAAIVAVLGCVKQLADHILTKSPNQALELPYK
jgi:beclin 1